MKSAVADFIVAYTVTLILFVAVRRPAFVAGVITAE